MNRQTLRQHTRRLCVTAMFMAMNIAVSSFGVPVPGGKIYLNDILIDTAAILLDPVSAFMVGGVGAFIGDLLFYPRAMFVSLVTHGLQAVVISLLSRHGTRQPAKLWTGLGLVLGAIVMVAGYSFGRTYFYGTREETILKLPYQILQAGVGAVAAPILCWKCRLLQIFNQWFSK